MIYFIIFLWWFVGFLSSTWIWYMEECFYTSNGRRYTYSNVQFKFSSLMGMVCLGVTGPFALVIGIGMWIAKFGSKIVLYTFHKDE